MYACLNVAWLIASSNQILHSASLSPLLSWTNDLLSWTENENKYGRNNITKSPLYESQQHQFQLSWQVNFNFNFQPFQTNQLSTPTSIFYDKSMIVSRCSDYFLLCHHSITRPHLYALIIIHLEWHAQIIDYNMLGSQIVDYKDRIPARK